MKLGEYVYIVDTAIQDRWKTLETEGLSLEGPNVVFKTHVMQYKVVKNEQFVLIEHTRVRGGSVSKKEIREFLESGIKELI